MPYGIETPNPCAIAGCPGRAPPGLTLCRSHQTLDTIAGHGHLVHPERASSWRPPARNGTVIVSETFLALDASRLLRVAVEQERGTTRVTLLTVVPTATSWTPAGSALVVPPRVVMALSNVLHKLAQRV